jgi:hypothetical protein
MMGKKTRRKRCKNCGEILNAVWFTALMTEEWPWNGNGYNECTAKNSLVNDYDQNVICPNCEHVVGTGIDFNFGRGFEEETIC